MRVKATVGALAVNFPMPDPNVCHSLINGYCPAEEDERLIYLLKLPVMKYYPKVCIIFGNNYISVTKTICH